ncbi:MAG: hypothetical protein WED86_03630 [Chloroflexota bacterium]
MLGSFFATILFSGAAFIGWYAFRTWQAERSSPLFRGLAFMALAQLASAFAALYFL